MTAVAGESAHDLRLWMDEAMHDLSQPLATLQCRLELGQMMGGEAALREAVDGGLGECVRIQACLQHIRERLNGVAGYGG